MKKTIKAADLFCGAGGTSTGLLEACKAMGLSLDLVAVNHWDIAISTHQANHPYAQHKCASLESINPRELVPGGRLNLLVASPECTHHANARGGRPMNDQSRASAWHVLRWVEMLYVENILIENVKEFRSWGPLGANGRPLKSKRGEFFFAFLNALKAAGYIVEHKVLRAADYGDPTTRERLFIIARRGNKKIIWPRQTHASMEKILRGEVQRDIFGHAPKLKAWVPARRIIDWSLPSKSIFNRKKPLAQKTLERIYAGLKKFGGPNAEPFLIVLRQHMSAQSLDEPLPTLTASGQHLGLVEPFTFAHQRRGNAAQSVNEPIQTLTATSSDFALVQPEAFLIGQGGPEGSGKPQSVDKPLDTVLTDNHRAVVEPFIVPNFGEREGQTPRSHSVDNPLPAVTGHGAGALVEPFILPHRMFDQGAPDSIDRPLRTIVGKNGRQVRVCEPVIMNIDHRGGNGDQTRSIEEPLSTVTTKARTALVEADAFIVDVNHGRKSSEKPETEAQRRVQSVDEPLGTVTASRRGKGVVQPCVVKYFGTATAQSTEEPLHTITGKARYALVTTDKGTYALDIRLRMLRPHELAAAMSMKGYVFKGKMEDQVKQIGNAVPVKLAKALCMEVIG